MSEELRVFLDLAVAGLKAEIGHLEQHQSALDADDRKEIQMAMARLNSLLTERRAAA